MNSLGVVGSGIDDCTVFIKHQYYGQIGQLRVGSLPRVDHSKAFCPER